MKFAHTADVHLADNSGIHVLNLVIDSAAAEGCTHLLIAGDLFENDKSGRALAAAVSSALKRFPGSVWIIPGNHDKNIGDYLFAANSKIFREPERVYLDGISILGVPFREGCSLYDLIVDSSVKKDPVRTIALLHGTYRGADGDNYFPVRPGDIDRLGIEYAALGHYHMSFIDRRGSSTAANPGAPRVTRDTDTGRRKFFIYDTESSSVKEVLLETAFRESVELRVTYTMAPSDILEALEKKLAEKIDPEASARLGAGVRINVSGLWSLSPEETELVEHKISDMCRVFSVTSDLRLDGVSSIDHSLLENQSVRALLDSAESSGCADIAAMKEFTVRLVSDIQSGRL